ncbi:MAG: lipoprotein signal peptidase [Gammaproteobacteria bacterium]|nr:lipoprotein signal peptidase [Gammaproteobacteria bacterium]
MRNRYRLLIWLVIVVAIVIADQVSKSFIVKNLMPGDSYHLFDWLSFTLVRNSGAAFSMLQRAGGWQRWIFVAVAAAISIMIIVSLIRMPARRWWQPLSLSLILGGALGNLYDRITLGYVNDFIDFHIGTWHFAIFNVADAAITVGVLLLLITLLLDRTGSVKRGQAD